MRITKQNAPLYLAFGLPVLFLLGMLLVSLLPSFLGGPNYDFIYTDSSRYYYRDAGNNFYVEDAKLKARTTPKEATDALEKFGVRSASESPDKELSNKTMVAPQSYYDSNEIERLRSVINTKFYRYRAGQSGVEQISFEKAAELKLSSLTVAPDGFSVERGTNVNAYGPFFFDTRMGSYVIKKGLYSKSIPHTESYSFEFIGWILEE